MRYYRKLDYINVINTCFVVVASSNWNEQCNKSIITRCNTVEAHTFCFCFRFFTQRENIVSLNAGWMEYKIFVLYLPVLLSFSSDVISSVDRLAYWIRVYHYFHHHNTIIVTSCRIFFCSLLWFSSDSFFGPLFLVFVRLFVSSQW